MVAATGTSSLGLVVWTVGLAAAGWSVRRFDLWFKAKKGVGKRDALKEAFEGGLRDALVEGVAIVVIALLAWGCFVPAEVLREHNAMVAEIEALKHQAKPPDLIAEKTFIFEGHNGIGDYVTVFGVEISNPSGPPRSLTTFTLDIVVDGNTITGREVLLRPEGLRGHAGNQTITIEAEQYCPKAMSEPLPSGGARQCWVAERFPSTIEKEFKKAKTPPVALLRFKDVLTGRMYEVKRDVVLNRDVSQMFP
jgi:hypothetical protein